MREKSYVCGFRSKNKFQLAFIWLTPIYKKIGYEQCTVPSYTTRSQSHRNFTICALRDKFDIFEDDTSALCREMFLKIARPDEKPEAGVSRVIYEIKPVEMP